MNLFLKIKKYYQLRSKYLNWVLVILFLFVLSYSQLMDTFACWLLIPLYALIMILALIAYLIDKLFMQLFMPSKYKKNSVHFLMKLAEFSFKLLLVMSLIFFIVGTILITANGISGIVNYNKYL